VGPKGLKRFIRGEIAAPHNTIQYVQYITYIGIQYGAILYVALFHTTSRSITPSLSTRRNTTYVRISIPLYRTILQYSTLYYYITSHHTILSTYVRTSSRSCAWTSYSATFLSHIIVKCWNSIMCASSTPRRSEICLDLIDS
jgi:hypothetical protein